MKKALRTLSLFLLFALIAVYAGLVYQNNQTREPPDHTRIQAAQQAAIAWMNAHQADILAINNPALWWMLQQSAARSGDPSLQALFERYRQKYLQSGKYMWEPMFNPGRWVPFKLEQVLSFDDYQIHLLYAINCDQELAQQPIIQEQLQSDYCASQPWRPACVTHQLIAMRFMQASDCGDAAATERTIAELQQRVVRQLTWDPRLVDVYLQRVLTLVESGRADAVKPVWLQRVLDAQRADGGWSNTQPLLTLPFGVSLGFSERLLSFAPPRSNFHATAQGLLLTSLLLESRPAP